MKKLTGSYLSMLTNADHYGVMCHITDYVTDDITTLDSNTAFTEAKAALLTAHAAEVNAYLQIRKDYNSEELKVKQKEMLGYMSAIRYTLTGMTYLPDSHEHKTIATKLLNIIKGFKMETKNGYETTSAKVGNIVEEFDKHTDWTDTLSLTTLVGQLNTACTTVRQLLKQRIQFEANRVKGLMATTRSNTDKAIIRVFDVLNSIQTLTPTAALTKNIEFLLAVEDRAKNYHISQASVSNSGSDALDSVTDDGAGTGGSTDETSTDGTTAGETGDKTSADGTTTGGASGDDTSGASSGNTSGSSYQNFGED